MTLKVYRPEEPLVNIYLRAVAMLRKGSRKMKKPRDPNKPPTPLPVKIAAAEKSVATWEWRVKVATVRLSAAQIRLETYKRRLPANDKP